MKFATIFGSYIYLLKNLYSRKNGENSNNAAALALFLFVLNLNSILLLLELDLNVDLGVIRFWVPSDEPKILYAPLIGGICLILWFFLIRMFKKHLLNDKWKILRLIVARKKQLIFSILYVVCSVVVFFIMIGRMIVAIIPDGGV